MLICHERPVGVVEATRRTPKRPPPASVVRGGLDSGMRVLT